jgi:hypothetical protein
LWNPWSSIAFEGDSLTVTNGCSLGMMEAHYLYHAYGLTIQSEICCPELEESAPGQEADVRIRRGPVPENLAQPNYAGYKCEADDMSLLIRTDRFVKLLISGGHQILVEEREGVQPHEIRTLMLGWGLGAVLHQRGILPLHASAVSTDDGCLAFCAPSGAGKSTLAYAFLKKGYRLLDDNIAAIKTDLDGTMVLPGYPELKLRGDALLESSLASHPLRPVLRDCDKFALSARDHFEKAPRVLRGIYVLSRVCAPALKLTRLKGGAAFQVLSENTFCARFVQGMGQPGKHFEMLLRLANQVPVYDMQFPPELYRPDELSQIIEDDCRKYEFS